MVVVAVIHHRGSMMSAILGASNANWTRVVLSKANWIPVFIFNMQGTYRS